MEPDDKKQDLIERDVVMRLLEVETPEALAAEMDVGRCPRPHKHIFDHTDPKTRRKKWRPLWLRGEVLACMQQLALRKVGMILDQAKQ